VPRQQSGEPAYDDDESGTDERGSDDGDDGVDDSDDSDDEGEFCSTTGVFPRDLGFYFDIRGRKELAVSGGAGVEFVVTGDSRRSKPYVYRSRVIDRRCEAACLVEHRGATNAAAKRTALQRRLGRRISVRRASDRRIFTGPSVGLGHGCFGSAGCGMRVTVLRTCRVFSLCLQRGVERV
jgi:hypothetical protein